MKEGLDGRSERNYGIDLLRLVSMFLVVLTHEFVFGGWAMNASAQSAVRSLLMMASRCCVNCFALISGYVMVESKFKYHRVFSLWVEVFFYGFLSTLLVIIFAPGAVGIKDWMRALFPVMGMQYWYFTAYAIMFFFIPFFNQLLNHLSDKALVRMQVLLVILVIISTNRLNITITDVFKHGYTVVWLSALYLLGGSMKKLKTAEKIQSRWLVILYIVGVLLSAGIYYGFQILGAQRALPDQMLELRDFLYDYSSVFALLTGISLFLLFAKLKIRNKGVIKVIKVCSPAAFGVYLLSTTVVMVDLFYEKGYACGWFVHSSAVVVFFGSILTAAAIFLVCLGIDLLRIQLFKLLKVDTLARKFSDWLAKKWNAFYGHIAAR